MSRKARNKLDRIAFRAKRYLRENRGDPFIIAFMIMLVVCAGLLALGNSALANEVAVYAYYFLVAGVALDLVCYLKYGRKENESEN